MANLNGIQCSPHRPAEGWRCVIMPAIHVIGILLLGITAHAKDPSGFKVIGTMSLSEHLGNNPVHQESWRFEASVIGDKYLYKLFSTNDQEFIFSSDGISTYSLFVDPAAKEKLRMPGYLGDAFNGRYPVNSFYISSALPWLAYCSGDVLAATVTNEYTELPAPWLCPWAMPSAYIYKVHYVPLQSGGHTNDLPGTLEYFVDGSKLEGLKSGIYQSVRKPSDSERDKIVIEVATLKDVGLPEGVYQVEETTNYNGLLLPTKFSFDRYMFKNASGSSQSRELFTTVHGRLISLESITTLNPLPTSPDSTTNIMVSDYRFANSQSGVVFLSYSTSKVGGWLTDTHDPFLQDLYVKDVKLHRGVIHINIPRSIVFVVFALLTVIPLIIWLRQTRRIREPLA